MPPGQLEQTERLEQLRILEAGESIAVGLVAAAPVGVDTEDDYAALCVVIARGERPA